MNSSQIIAQNTVQPICTVNNVQVQGPQCTEAANQLLHNASMDFLMSHFWWFFGTILLVNLICLAVWLVALIHAVKHTDIPDRNPWIIGLVLAGPVAAIAYFFIVKRPYDAKAGQLTPAFNSSYAVPTNAPVAGPPPQADVIRPTQPPTGTPPVPPQF